MKADFMHQLIHYKSGSGHIAGIFQNGHAEKQYPDDGNKHQYTSNPSDNPVNYQPLHDTSFSKQFCDCFSNPPLSIFYQNHERLTNSKGKFEHHPQQTEENRPSW